MHGSWTALAAGVLGAPGLAANLDPRRATHQLAWEHGAAEASLAGVAGLLERLQRLRASWRALAWALQHDAATTPSSSPAPGGVAAWHAAAPSDASGDAAAAAETLRVGPEAVTEALRSQSERTAVALEQLRSQLSRRVEAARADLPVLRANEARAVAYLEARRAATLRGLARWAQLWADERTRRADLAADEMLGAAAAATDALHARLAEAEPGGPDADEAGRALAAAAAEQSRLDAALAALALGQRALHRRAERLAEETRVAAAVRARALRRAAADEARLVALRAAARRVIDHLEELGSETAPARAEEALALLLELHSRALAPLRRTLLDTATFTDDAAAAVRRLHAALLERCVRDLTELGEVVAERLRSERDKEVAKQRGSLGREVLGTLSKAVNSAAIAAAAAAASGESEEEGESHVRTAGRGLVAGALRRAAAVAGAAARAYEGLPIEQPEPPLQGAPGERAPSPPPTLEDDGRRKSRVEKSLEDELRALHERRHALSQRREAQLAILAATEAAESAHETEAPEPLEL